MRDVVTGSDGNTPSLNFPARNIIFDQPSLTSLLLETTLDADMKITVQQVNPTTEANIGSSFVINKTAAEEKLITGLSPGLTYKITVQAKNGSSVGNSQTLPPYTMSTASFGGTVVSNPISPSEITSAKSYLELSYLGKKKGQFALAYKTFNGINLPSESEASSSLPEHLRYMSKAYAESYYTFGTSIFMDSNEKYPNQSGGLGFFLNSSGTSGYYVFVETTSAASAADRNSIRIVKMTPSGAKTLADSQKTTETTFDGIYGGKSYAIDVKVRVLAQSVTITAYINGFKVKATDTNDFTNSKSFNFIIPPSETVGLAALKGKSLFDYVYGTSIEKEQYDSSEYNINLYQGQFSNDTLDTAYGNTLYNSNYAEDEIHKAKNIVEEFGSVVREIVHVKQKLDARPAFPIRWSTGSNRFAKMIGSKISSFSGEAYVLNNTSTTIPLADGAGNELYVFGNHLEESGTLEYSTDETDSYNHKEPVIFQSTWLQNESDVKALANWIKDKVVNRGRVVNMSVFGNPLISVGDIVTIKYDYQGFAGTEKLIVTSISHRYSEGLETSITCRTL